MNKISCCRICESERIIPFFDLGIQPLANSLLDDLSEQEQKYPLSLSFCSDCNLVQLNHTIDPKLLFSNYVWLSSTSTSSLNYAKQFCQSIIRKKKINKDSYILEIASNDGSFLMPFIQKGINVLGVDPAENIVDIARKNGIPTICSFWKKSLADEIKAEKGYPSIIFARNVLPHVANINEFMSAVRMIAQNDTLLVFEVHYAGKILDELHYDSIYHEHLCYFSLKSLESLLMRHQIFINDIFESPISGGSIVVFAGIQKKEKSAFLKKYGEQESNRQINMISKWTNFSKLATAHKEQMNAMIEQQVQKGAMITGYGASARSSTLLNYCNISSEQIKVIADKNFLKQNKYTPGSKILINTPDNVLSKKPDVIVILAWNFLAEIADILMNYYNYSKEILIPLPYPPKLINIKETSND